MNRPRFVPGAASTRPNTGDDFLEAVTIMQDVVQRRRRVFGPAHPKARHAERVLSDMHAERAAMSELQRGAHA